MKTRKTEEWEKRDFLRSIRRSANGHVTKSLSSCVCLVLL